MASLEFSDVQLRRREMAEDAGATTATKDSLARSYHGKTVRAVGRVEDVVGQNEQLTVHLANEGETMSCPLVRVHGRSMEDTIAEVISWRIGDAVEVSGKLAWPSFSSPPHIDILSAAKAGAGAEPAPDSASP